jgi:hypothetical protein
VQEELLKQIAVLPGTTVQPHRRGGGVTIIETRSGGVTQTSVWLDRANTVSRLQAYLESRDRRDEVEELRAQLRAAQHHAEHSGRAPERAIARLMAKRIEREIEALNKKSVDA